MSTDLTVVNPGALMTQATDVAGVCAEIVKRTARMIGPKKYVQVEGWQSIAAAYGCVASSKNVERVAGGVRAIGELRRVSDGALIATAEGFVGEDEATWYGGEITSYGKTKTLPKRPDFAIQAMAQTRAISRVCRTAFAFVVVLIDGNLSTTPAEEMSGIVHDQDTTEIPSESAKATPEQITAIKTALKENGVELTALLAKAGITDITAMPAEDCDKAITWIKIKKKAA